MPSVLRIIFHRLNAPYFIRRLLPLAILIIGGTQQLHAQTIANCGPVAGKSFYHYAGSLSKKLSGWDDDRITKGVTTFQKLPDGGYDIMLVDARGKIISLVGDGGKVAPLRAGKKDATFIHLYPGAVIDLFTLWEDNEGQARYDLIQSRGGDGLQIHKSSVLTGKCEFIHFDLIK